MTRCRSEGGVGKRKNTKQTLAEAESTNPGRDTARDESSFTRGVVEALFAVEMNTVSMRTGDVQQLDNACVRNCLILRPAISRSLSEQELLCKKFVAVEPCR